MALAGAATLLAGVSPALADGSITLSASPDPAVLGEPVHLSAQGTLPIDCVPDSAGDSNCSVSFFIQPPGESCADAYPGEGDSVPVTGAAGSAFQVADQSGRYATANTGVDGPGTATVCGFLSDIPPGQEQPVVSATAQLPLAFRGPSYSLSLTVPKRATAGTRIKVTVTAHAEAQGEIAAQVLPRGYKSCAAARGPLEAPALFLVWDRAQQDVWAPLAPGNFTATRRVKPVRPGRYIFCAWLNPLVGGDGRDITVQKKQVVRAAKSHKRHKRR